MSICKICQGKRCLQFGRPCKIIEIYLLNEGIYSRDYPFYIWYGQMKRSLSRKELLYFDFCGNVDDYLLISNTSIGREKKKYGKNTIERVVKKLFKD